MFAAQITFISLTLVLLVGISFWLKVPKASIPLLFIYLFFLIQNQSSNKPEKSNAEYAVPVTSNYEDNKERKYQVDGNLKSKNIKNTIEPKPLTFDSQPKYSELNKIDKSELKPENSLKKELVKEKNLSLTVKDIKICKSIYKRTPVGSDIIFTSNVDSLYCYTRIQNPGPKREVKHIWYYDNQMMTQVRYNVKKSNIYRSWTKKTILPNQIGNWRVDIQDNNGTVIGSKTFKIKSISDYN